MKSAEEINEAAKKWVIDTFDSCEEGRVIPNYTEDLFHKHNEASFRAGVKWAALPVDGYREAQENEEMKFAEWASKEHFVFNEYNLWMKDYDDGIHDAYTSWQLYHHLFKAPQEQGEKQEQK